MKDIERRVERLEGPQEWRAGRLPTIVPDDAPQAEIDRLRRRGIDVHRFGDPATIDRFAP